MHDEVRSVETISRAPLLAPGDGCCMESQMARALMALERIRRGPRGKTVGAVVLVGL